MSRPLTRGEPADHVLRFRVTRTEYSILQGHACANSVTVSQLIAEAVAEYAADLADGNPLDFQPLRTQVNSPTR